MSERKEAVEKEYMMLREETMYLQKRRENISQFTYTVGIALFAGAFASGISWVNLCILPFVFSASLKAVECGNSLAYLSSYMKVILEDNIDIKWATQNHRYITTFPKKGFSWLLHFFGRCDFAFLALVSCFLFWIMRDFNFYIHGKLIWGIIMLVIQFVFIVFELYLSIYYSNYIKIKEKALKNWRYLKEIQNEPH